MQTLFKVLIFAVFLCSLSAADSTACARCHRQIVEDYALTGMARSFFRPAVSNTVEAYTADFYHALSDTHFAMIRRDGRYYQRRWQIGFSGKETNVEEFSVDYVLGSGNHARSYLHKTERGTLIELPLGWYSEGGGHWAMSPGSDSDHPRTRRFVSYKCMFCHNAVPQIPAGNEVPDSDPVFTGELPHGIDCERCHGPGEKHIQSMGTRATIVNPARLSPERRTEVCMQCHLETTSGRIPSSIVRFDRGPFSFVPGESLAAFMLTFDHAPGTGHENKFEAVSSVYRLRQSQCFLKSEGKLTCDTCHNPHKVPRGAEAVAYYSSVCTQCHAGSVEHAAGAGCITCHMPKRRAQDTPGMVMTDHLIQRHPPPGDLLAQFREPAPEEYHAEVMPYYPAPSIYTAVAQVGLSNNLEGGLPLLAREIATQKPRDAEFYIVLGDAWKSAGKFPEAIAAYEQASLLSPKSVRALRALAVVQPTRADEILKRALQIAPSDATTWYQYGMLDFSVDSIQRAIALDPSLPDLSRGLAEALLKAGDKDQAQVALREALRTDPYDDSAWDLEARILTEKGEMPEAIYDFEKAIRLAPRDATHFYDYALALARVERFDEAQKRVESAIDIDPTIARAHELLGRIFEAQHRTDDAVREYRRTLQLEPAADGARARLNQLGAR